MNRWHRLSIYLFEHSEGENGERCIKEIIEADEIWIVDCLQVFENSLIRPHSVRKRRGGGKREGRGVEITV